MAEVVMYGLSTCPHCKKALELLKREGVDFEVVWVDKLQGEERKKAVQRIHSLTGGYSVPVVVKGDRHVVGYNEEKLMNLLRG